MKTLAVLVVAVSMAAFAPVTASAIAEPAAMLLLGTVLLCSGWLRRHPHASETGEPRGATSQRQG